MSKELIVPRPSVARRKRVPSLVDRLARSLALRALQRIEVGRLTVREPGEVQTYGDPTADELTLRVRHPRFWRSVAFGGSLGAGEAYIRGDWSTDNLTGLIRLLAANEAAVEQMNGGWRGVAASTARLYHRGRANTTRGSRRNIVAHYDLSNEFYGLFLDPTLTYSCGVFERADSTMQEASLAKLERACRKLRLRADDHVLEIGSGWGSFALYAARHYGCRVTTTTISDAQHRLVRQRIDASGLANRVTLLKQDYRALDGQYDKLVSIEMIEAVGHEYFDTFFRCCSRLLKRDGLMVLQAITMAERYYEHARRDVDFIKRYIFPGSCIPSIGAMLGAVQRSSDLQPTHIEDFGTHYARTLEIWRRAFLSNVEEVRRLGFDDAFIRMWEYYLSYCEAGFRERTTGVAQIVLAKPGHRDVQSVPAMTELERGVGA